MFEHTGADRAVAEKFINRRFAERFGARVEAFMPRLFTVRNQDGFVCGAFGLRAASHKLFVEHHFDQPIEKIIAVHSDDTVDRLCIVEVGHLSATLPGAMRAMIWLMTERLHREGAKWIVFTGSAGLRNTFLRMGLAPIGIRLAGVECVPAETRAASAGYHSHSPWVLITKIEEGYRTLVRNRKNASDGMLALDRARPAQHLGDQSNADPKSRGRKA